MKKEKNYVVRKYVNGCCFDSGVYGTKKAAVKFAKSDWKKGDVTSYDIVDCESYHYGDNWVGWVADGKIYNAWTAEDI